MSGGPGWWQRLGGRYAVSVPAWLFTLVGGTAAAFSWIPDGPDVQPLAWVGLSVLAHVLLGGFLLLAWLTYLSPRPRPSRTPALIATLLVAGWVRGAFLAVVGERLNLVDDGDVFERAAGAAIAFAVWYSLATLIVDGWRGHRATVASLQGEMRREQELADRASTMLSDFRSRVVEQTQAALTAGLQEASAASGEPGMAADSLRRTVDELIRPLSHELEKRAIVDAELLAETEHSPELPRFPLLAYVSGMFTVRPFAPLVTAAVVIATPLVVTMHVLGAVIGVIAVLLSGIVVGLLLRALRAPVMRAVPRWSRVQSAAAVLASWLAVTVAVGLLLGALVKFSGRTPDSWLQSVGLSATGSSLIVILVLALTTMVAAAAEGSVEHELRVARDELRNAVLSVEWAAARLRQRAWNEQRSFGRLLHGTVQATMVAAAIKIRDQSPEEAAVSIAVLTIRLQYALGAGVETPWRREVANLSDVWDGAIQLEVVVTKPAELVLDEDPLAAHSLFQVLSEGVTNAVRHGDANSVRVTVEADPSYLVLTVMDDGIPTRDRGEDGTGAKVYRANCADWQLTFDSTTILRARIAFGSDTMPVFTGTPA